MYEPRSNALLVAPLDSTLAGPRDVRERTVAFANPVSLVALYGQQWLRQAGLEPDRDYTVKPARTDLGVGRMLLTGEAAAAVMSHGEFRTLPAEESTRLKVVEIFARIPIRVSWFGFFVFRWQVKCCDGTGSLSGKADGHDSRPAASCPFASRGLEAAW